MTKSAATKQPWSVSSRFSRSSVAIADRHYSRQKVGTPQFVAPGRCLVLRAPGPCLWVTSWPRFAQHRWRGAWVNTLFRREGGDLASDLIRAAVAATRWQWPLVPHLGMVTFVDPRKVRSENPGYCYLKAGFRRDGCTRSGLLAFRLHPTDMPEPVAPVGAQLSLGVA